MVAPPFIFPPSPTSPCYSPNCSRHPIPSRFQHTPVDVLATVFGILTPKERVSISRTCKQWKEIIEETQSFWRDVLIPENETIESAIDILSTFSENSNMSLTSVVINSKVPEEDLDEVLEILEESWEHLGTLHINQDPSLNSKTRTFARMELPWLEVLSTLSRSYAGHFLEKWDDTLDDSDSLSASRPVRALLLGLYVDDLKDVTAEDLDWIQFVGILQVRGSTDSLDSLHEILLSMKSSLEGLDLGFYRCFERISASRDLQEERFPLLDTIEITCILDPVLPFNWKFPALFNVTADPSTLLELNPQVLKGVDTLTLHLTGFMDDEERSETGSDDGSQVESLEVFEVSDCLALCPNVKWLEFNFSISANPFFEIDDLLFEINSTLLGPIRSPLLQEKMWDDHINLDRPTMVELHRFIEVRNECLKEHKMIDHQTTEQDQGRKVGKEPPEFRFSFRNDEENLEFEKKRDELRVEMESKMG